MREVVWFILIFLGVFFFLIDRRARQSVFWTVAWGLAGGVWLLGPALVRAHHAVATNPFQWLPMDIFLAVLFIATSAALGLVIAVPPAAYRLATRHISKFDGFWGTTLWTALLLPSTYLMASATIEWTNFNRIDSGLYIGPVAAFFAAHLAGVAVLGAVFLPVSEAEVGRHRARLLRAIASTILLGFVALPFRVPLHASPAVRASPLHTTTSLGSSPFLVIGLDGGNWDTIRPLVEAGKLPTFARLIVEGMSGNMDAAWPPYWSAPAWATLMTGYGPDDTGLHEDLYANVRGLLPLELTLSVDPLLNPILACEYIFLNLGWIEPMPAPRYVLKRDPIWTRLSQSGLKTAVVRFPFTYPSERQADVVVSNRIVNDLWDAMGVRTGERNMLVFPPSDTDRVLAHFELPEEADQPLVRQMLGRDDWRMPPGDLMHPVQVIRRAVHIQREMHDASLDILNRHRDLDGLFLYIAGLDNLSHALWPYHRPGEFQDAPPAVEDVAVLGPVIDRYMEWLDAQLGELIEAFPTRPTVIVLSDHGETRSDSTTAWRGWHGAKGIFIASGPGVSKGRHDLAVTYFDLVPTLIELTGRRADDRFQGRSVLHGRK